MKNVKVTVSRLADGVCTFEEGDGHYINAYLIIGRDSALLVDTLCECENLYERVRELTSLPLTVLITHGHGDHAGVSTRAFREHGCRVYMSHDDLPVLNGLFGETYPDSFFEPLTEGMEFDAGGFVLKTIAVPGHTPGSVVFLEEEKQLLFSGDTIGSGMIWMQIPGCTSLSVLQKGLHRLYETVKGLSALQVFPGHRYQSPVPLGCSYVGDVMQLTDDLLSGKNPGREAVMDFHGREMKYRTASCGDMREFCYDPARLREERESAGPTRPSGREEKE